MNIQEHENSMTIFYRKADGAIKRTTTGIQNMGIFGDEAEDYSLIWDYVILDKDEYVLRNPFNFRVNPTTKQIEIKESNMMKYKIAKERDL